jgi:hypothetical protein
MAFLAAHERTLRVGRQAAVVDAIFDQPVQGLMDGMVEVIATFVPGSGK